VSVTSTSLRIQASKGRDYLQSNDVTAVHTCHCSQSSDIIHTL